MPLRFPHGESAAEHLVLSLNPEIGTAGINAIATESQTQESSFLRYLLKAG